jgi:hypothetical protein
MIFSAFATQSAVVDIDGKDAHYWTYASVVYCEVISSDEYEKNRYKLALKPIATFTGSLDSALHDRLVFENIVANKMFDGIAYDIPANGSKVVVVVEDYTNTEKPHYFIPPGPVHFMPRGHGLIEVTGFDDPKVTETIENLRKLRGKQREDAEKQSAAEKKSSAEPKSKP